MRMSTDLQTYRRGAGAALLGLIVQTILALAVMVLGLYAQSPAIHAAAWHFLGGIAVWGVVWVLYHQHSLERSEALEFERLSQSSEVQAGALFDERMEDSRWARRRLAHLYKWGLGGVSLAATAYLLLMGLWLLRSSYNAYVQGVWVDDALGEGVNTTALMAVLIGVAFVAFTIARYESGMTKAPQWSLLRGAAGYLMGNFIVAMALLIGAIGAHYENLALMGFLSFAIPGLMVLLGTEVFLALMLNSYRPRRLGEVARPAFDSRLLGLMTSPGSIAKAIGDALNYQFGFEVSRSWFYQLLSQAITPLTLFGVSALVLLSGVVIVSPHEEGVVTRFGRIRGEPLGPGIHFKMPWPIDRVRQYPVGRVHQVLVGSSQDMADMTMPALWSNHHHGEDGEQYLITAPTPLARQDQSDGEAVSGMSLVGAQVVVQYRVADLLRYLSAAQRGREMLAAIAESNVNAYFVTQDIDTLLGAGRTVAGQVLRGLIQSDVDDLGLGVEVIFVGINNIHPPAEMDVAAAFLEQIGASQQRHSTIEHARQEAHEALATVAGSSAKAQEIERAILELQRRVQDQSQQSDFTSQHAAQQKVLQQQVKMEKLLAAAGGRAAQLIYEARADRWERVVAERAMADRFTAELKAYGYAPDYYRARRYLDTLASGLKDVRKYIVVGDPDQRPVFRIDMKDARSTMDSILEGGR